MKKKLLSLIQENSGTTADDIYRFDKNEISINIMAAISGSGAVETIIQQALVLTGASCEITIQDSPESEAEKQGSLSIKLTKPSPSIYISR